MGRIVWIASYPKSGNTWMRAFLWNYLRNPDRREPLDELSRFAVSESHPELYRQFAENGDLLSLSPEHLARHRLKVHARIAEMTKGTTYVKSHNYMGSFGGYPLYNLQVTAAAIYIVRSPLDVVISTADHFGLTVDEAIDSMANEETAGPTDETAVAEFYSSWSTHVASWTTQKNPNVLVVRYEDMLERPEKAFSAVLKLLKQPKNPNRLKNAIESSSFQQLRSQETTHGFGERSRHSRWFFRSGRRDQWRDALSKQQIERVIGHHELQMKRFDYIPRVY